MGKLNSYAIVFGSSLAWSLVAVIGGSFVEPGGLFTTLTIGLLAVAALVLPLGLKKIPDLLNEDLYQAGLLLGLLTGALGLGSLLSALQYISPLWVLGAILCVPLLSAVIGAPELKGSQAVAIPLGCLGLTVMTGGNELADSQIGGLLLCGLGVVSMSLGLSWYRLKSRNQSKIGLAFWALIGAAIFLLPAALAEQVYLTGWALNQFAAGAALALSFLIGLACWVWLEDRDRPNEDRLPLALTPLLGLVFLILPLGLEIKSWEVTGLILVGLALHISGRTEAGEPAEISQPLPFEQKTTEPIEQRKVA